MIAEPDHRELDGGLQVHIYRHFRLDPVLDMLENGIAESMSGSIRRFPTGRQGSRAPENAAFLITYIEDLSRRIADGIVIPGRKPEFMGILHPGIGLPALRDHRSEMRVGQHIAPGCRSDLPPRTSDHVFASIMGESALSVKKEQVSIVPQRLHDLCLREIRLSGDDAWDRRPGRTPPADMITQVPCAVGESNTRHRLQQYAVLQGDLICYAYKDAAGTIRDIPFYAGADQAQQLTLQQLAITSMILIPDHEVYDQPLETPVGMCLHQLFDQVDIGRVFYLYQHDGQVAGNGIAPEPRLAPLVLAKDGRVRAQQGIAVDNAAGQTPIDLRVRFGRIDLPEHDLAMRPGQFERTVGKMTILVFFDQPLAYFPGLSHAEYHIDRDGFLRIEGDAVSDRDDGVQHGALCAGQRPLAQGLWLDDRIPASDELHPVRLVGYLVAIGSM